MPVWWQHLGRAENTPVDNLPMRQRLRFETAHEPSARQKASGDATAEI